VKTVGAMIVHVSRRETANDGETSDGVIFENVVLPGDYFESVGHAIGDMRSCPVSESLDVGAIDQFVCCFPFCG
jgi:hypothetical protein